MSMERPDYIPARYQSTCAEAAVVWTRGPDASTAAEPLATELVERALVDVGALLGHRLHRTVHVVVYASLDDSRAALDRLVSPCALLAPFHTADCSLIALHSPRVDPRNGDARRMWRHVCHEVSHVFSVDKTGSRKRLGDGDRHMRVAGWVNEGLAENVAAQVARRPDVIDRALAAATGAPSSLRGMDSLFPDPGPEREEWAYAVATAAVWRSVRRYGLRFVFEHQVDPRAWRISHAPMREDGGANDSESDRDRRDGFLG